MKKYLSILVLSLFIVVYGYAQQKQSVSIKLIQSKVKVLEEWKKPGLYSPANLFDGDMGTCYAEGEEVDPSNMNAEIKCDIYFDKLIYIDEIRVVNGFAKNDEYYFNNNRILNLSIIFSNSKLDVHEIGSEYFTLKDTREYQSFKLKKAYNANSVLISNGCLNENCNSIIKGSKYNDTCITELEFYYLGKKIEIANLKQIKKNYINQIQLNLSRFLSDKPFAVYFTTPADYMTGISLLFSHKDGNLNFENIEKNKYFKGDIKSYMPDMWKVEDSKLFMRLNGKWLLYKYYLKFGYENVFNPEDLFLYTMPFEGLPAGSEFIFSSPNR